MGHIAARFVETMPSATVAIMVLAQELRRQGRDIISLAAGEPDFDTPEHIREAAYVAIKRGATKYAPPNGLPELRDAIVHKLRRDNGLTYLPNDISVGCGAKQAIFTAFMATLEPGDEVIVPSPHWGTFVDIPPMFGATCVSTPCLQVGGFKLNPEALERAITPRTKWLVLCSPSNPAGTVYSSDELRAIGEVLRRHPRVWVLWDHIYEHIVYDMQRAPCLPEVCADLQERCLLVNGVSKAYCMTGWRVGFAAGPRPVIEIMNAIQSQATTSTSTISQWAAVAALIGDQSFIQRNNAEFRRRRDMVVTMLNATSGLDCARPAGAFYVYPSCSGVIGKRTPGGGVIADDRAFVEYLLRETGVAVVPGQAFNLSPHFRISYAARFEDLEAACMRIQKACADLSETARAPRLSTASTER